MNNYLKRLQKDYNIIASDYALKRSQPGQKMSFFSKYLKKAKRVLDLGCGNGRFFELIPPDCQYLGLDFSPNLLAIAKKRYPKAKFVLGDMTNKKIWQKIGKFDQIYSFASFHHLLEKEDQKKVLEYSYKALSKKGLLVIVVWNLWQFKYLPLHLSQLAFKKIKVPYRLSDGKRAVKTILRWYYAFFPWELKKLVKKAGFLVEKTFWFNGNNFFNAQEFGLLAKKW